MNDATDTLTKLEKRVQSEIQQAIENAPSRTVFHEESARHAQLLANRSGLEQRISDIQRAWSSINSRDGITAAAELMLSTGSSAAPLKSVEIANYKRDLDELRAQLAVTLRAIEMHDHTLYRLHCEFSQEVISALRPLIGEFIEQTRYALNQIALVNSIDWRLRLMLNSGRVRSERMHAFAYAPVGTLDNNVAIGTWEETISAYWREFSPALGQALPPRGAMSMRSPSAADTLASGFAGSTVPAMERVGLR